MKCLSLHQPWATLAVLGAKRYETRAWQTGHRGRLAIHASTNFPPAARALCRTEPFRTLLLHGGHDSWTELPTGVLLGEVHLLRCLPVEELLHLPADVRALGDFRPGRWAWEFDRPRRLNSPIPWRGRLGLFEVPELPA